MNGFQPKRNIFYGVFLLSGLLSTEAYALPVQSITKDTGAEITQFNQQQDLYFNSAEGKRTNQSSTAFGGDAFSAVDGNTSGVYQNIPLPIPALKPIRGGRWISARPKQ